MQISPLSIASQIGLVWAISTTADAAPDSSYSKFQSIGFSMDTGPVDAIDWNATYANLEDCKYTTENCPTAVWWKNASDEESFRTCLSCFVATEGCGVFGQNFQPGVDSVAWNGTDIQSSKCYLGKEDIEEDVKGRVSIMQRAVEKAYEVASQDKDTLKIFVAPEFFWRGPKGSYSFDTIDNPDVEGEFNAINEIGRALEDIIQQDRFNDWMFLFGTIIASKETNLETPKDGGSKRAVETNGKLFQFLNFAPLYKGFDPAKTNSDGMKFIVPKQYVSNIDFLTEDRAPNPYDGISEQFYDNVLLDEIVDSLEEHGYGLINHSWFYMNDIAMSLEICLDHLGQRAKNMLLDPNVTMVPSGGFGEYRELLKPEGAQISLVSSAGMSIIKDSLVLESGGTVFLQDGLDEQVSAEQTCEFNDPGGKEEGFGLEFKWFCSEHSYSVHPVYASLGETEAALRGLFSTSNSALPEIHLFKPLDIISVGGDDATIGDVGVASNGTSTVTNISMESNEDDTSSAGAFIIKHEIVTVAMIVTFLFSI